MKSQIIVANAIRMEIDPTSGDMFLVFKIIDESFKKKVRDNWNKDLPLKVIGKNLIEVK